MSKFQPQALTTPRTRAESKASAASLAEVAALYSVTEATVREWKSREAPDALSHRPHQLNTTLTPRQGTTVVELRHLVMRVAPHLAALLRDTPLLANQTWSCLTETGEQVLSPADLMTADDSEQPAKTELP